MSVCFDVGCETLCRGGCSGTVMRFSTCDARLRGYSCFRLPYFGSVLNCQYRSIQVQVSIFQHSTIAALYKKGPGVCRGARLVPLCGFLTFQCDLPSAGPQPMRHIRLGLRNLYYATIYPTEIYKVPFDTFRLSVELPIQKHTGTS